jgi:hypothetical protein
MPDPLQELLAAEAVPTTTFPPTSRYAAVGVTAWDPGLGRLPIAHLGRRLCPGPERFALLHEAQITEGDRRDTLAARQFSDAELWWRLADSNGVVDPRDLASPVGRTLRITLPEDVPEPSNG